MGRGVWRLHAAVCAAVLAAACARPAQLAYETESAEAPVAARHAVHSARLRELMGALGRLERGRLPQAMDVELERERRTRDVARAARDLAGGASELARLAPELDLAPAERAAFVGLARRLERDSRTLAEQAPELSPAALGDAAARIRADCERCHERFRVPPIPLER
ncbi:MAG: hypothetical protein ACQGVC_13735 [Myxococcota bacterium]